MIAALGTQAVLERPEFKLVEPKVTQLERTSLSQQAPWLPSALSEVWNLEQAGEFIPGIGDLRIAPDTAHYARLLLSHIAVRDLPSPIVSAFSGGGLSFRWDCGARSVKYSIFPEGVVSYLCEDQDEVFEDGVCHALGTAEVTRPLKWLTRP